MTKEVFNKQYSLGEFSIEQKVELIQDYIFELKQSLVYLTGGYRLDVIDYLFSFAYNYYRVKYNSIKIAVFNPEKLKRFKDLNIN